MENLKLAAEGLSSKVLKILALAISLGAAEQAYSQIPMEQLVKEAKVIELKLSEDAAKRGELSLLNNIPAATLSNDSSRLQVTYSDNERTKPTGFLVCKNKTYMWDKNVDGKADGVYIDKNDNGEKKPTDEEFLKTQITIVKGGPEQTELELSDMMNDGKGNHFVYFNLDENTVSTTADKEIIGIPESEREHVNQVMQKKFMSELRGLGSF